MTPIHILRFDLEGTVPSKKNGKMLTRGRLITNPDTQRRLAEITLLLKTYRRAKLRPLTNCRVTAIFTVSSRRSDLDNGLTSLMDCLVKAGIIKDDSMYHTNAIEAYMDYCGEYGNPKFRIEVSGEEMPIPKVKKVKV